MNCQQVKATLLLGDELSEAGRTHSASCPACGELSGGLARALASAEQGAPALEFAALQDRIARREGALTRLRELPTPTRLALLLVVVTAVALVNLLLLPRVDLAEHPAPRMALALGVLILPLAVAVWALTRPLQRPPLRAGVWWTLVALGVAAPMFLSALPPAYLGNEACLQGEGGMLFQKAAACFLFGALCAAPLLALGRALERDPKELALGLPLLAAGAALSANLALQLHCPVTEQGHLLLGHGGLAVALVGGAFLLSRLR